MPASILQTLRCLEERLSVAKRLSASVETALAPLTSVVSQVSGMVDAIMSPQDYAYAEAVRLIPKQEPGQPPPGTVGGFLTQWYLARALAQFAGCYDAQDLIKRHISTMYAVTVDHEWVSSQAFKAIPSEKWGLQRQDSAMEQLMTVREIMSRLGFNSMAAGIDFLLLGD